MFTQGTFVMRKAQHLQKISNNYKVTFKKFAMETFCAKVQYVVSNTVQTSTSITFAHYRDKCNMFHAQYTGNTCDR